jgi:hypothetical protein
MTDARSTLPDSASRAADIVPGIRWLTAAETAHLDRARAHLRSAGIDVSDPTAVGALLYGARTKWAAGPASAPPSAMILAVGVGVGDMLVARVPGARWALHHGSDDPTPTVVSASGLDAALPLTDVRARGMTGCTPDWVAEYVASAAAHLVVGGGHTAAPATVVTPEPAAAPAPAPAQAPAVSGELPSPRQAADDRPGTPAELPYPPSAAVQDLALGALEHALETILAATPDSRPFVLIEGVHGPEVHAFDGAPDDAQRIARAWVRGSGAARAAVAWYGSLLAQDAGVVPVVMVEASDAHQPSLVVAHRYATATPAGEGRARPARALGDPLIIGQGDALL